MIWGRKSKYEWINITNSLESIKQKSKCIIHVKYHDNKRNACPENCGSIKIIKQQQIKHKYKQTWTNKRR